jgi:homocysteine S-methyltransferase
MGTELQRRGYDTSLPLWSARPLLEHPEAVLQIHREYATAGADVLVTNTFRTHRRNLTGAGLGHRAEELTRLAVDLCRQAAGTCRVAGSISPLEECYSPGLSPQEQARAEHEEMAGWLADAGVDLLLVETMPTVAEACTALQAAKETGLETWVSLVPDGLEDPVTLDGVPLAEAAGRVLALGPDAILVNCAAPAVVEAAARVLAGHPDRGAVPFGAYANNGSPSERGGWRFDRELPVGEFAAHCLRLAEMGAGIVGGCCGTTPEHIRAMAEALRC